MKRIITIITIITIIFCCSCSKNEALEDGVIQSEYTKTLKVSLDNIHTAATDIFVAEIVSATKSEKPIEFPIVKVEDAYQMVYTVLVKEKIWGVSVTENTKEQLISFIPNDKTSEYYEDPLVVGKKYLIAGMLQPYNDETVIVAMDLITSEITETNELIPQKATTKELLKEYKTYDSFLNSDIIQKLKQDSSLLSIASNTYDKYVTKKEK